MRVLGMGLAVSAALVSACSSGSSVGSSDSKDRCGRGTVLEDGKCVATDGAVCGPGTHDDGTGQCVADASGGLACGTGTHDDGNGNCVPDGGAGSCGAGTHDNGSGLCVPDACQPGTHMDSAGHCVPDACAAGTHNDGSGHCVPDACQPGTHPDGNGHCVADPAPARLAAFEVTVAPMGGGCPLLVEGVQIELTITARDQNGAVLQSFEGPAEVEAWGLGGLVLADVFQEIHAPYVFSGFVDGALTVYPVVLRPARDAQVLILDRATRQVGGASELFEVYADAPTLVATGPNVLVREDEDFELEVEMVSSVCGSVIPWEGTLEVSLPGGFGRVLPRRFIAGGTGTDTVTLRIAEVGGDVTLDLGNGTAVGTAQVSVARHIGFLGVERGWGRAGGEAVVSWSEPSGGTGNFTYEVFVADAPAEQDFAAPPAAQVTSLSAALSGLAVEAPTFVVVRARDGIDDDDDENTIEIAVVPGDAEYVDATSSALDRDGSAGKPWQTIREAIDNLGTTSAKNIYVAEGVYPDDLLPGSALAVPSGVQLIGGWLAGPTANDWKLPGFGYYSVLGGAGAAVHNPAIELSSGTRLDGFSIGDDVYAAGPQARLIYLYDAEHAAVRNSILTPSSTAPITAMSVSTRGSLSLWNTELSSGVAAGYPCATATYTDLDVTWSTLQGCTVGVGLLGASSGVVSRTTISDAEESCAYAGYGSTVVVTDSHLGSCGDNGLVTMSGTAIVAGSVIDGAETSCVLAASLGSAPFLVAFDNSLSDCAMGVYTFAATPYVISNRIEATDAGVMALSTVGGAAVIGNDVTAGTTSVVVGLEDQAAVAYVSYNTLSSEAGWGAYVGVSQGAGSGYAHAVQVIGNQILRAALGGLVVSSFGTGAHDLEINDNTMGWVGGAGIVAYSGGGSSDITLEDNTVDGGDGLPIPGIGIFAVVGDEKVTATITARGNRVENVSQAGIFTVVDATPDSHPAVEISSNVVSRAGGGVAAIITGSGYEGAYPAPNDATISGNIVSQVDGAGVSLYGVGAASRLHAIDNQVEPGRGSGLGNAVELIAYAADPAGTPVMEAIGNEVRAAAAKGVVARLYGDTNDAELTLADNRIWGSTEEALSAIMTRQGGAGRITVAGNRVLGGVYAQSYPGDSPRLLVGSYSDDADTEVTISNNVVEDENPAARVRITGTAPSWATASGVMSNNVFVTELPAAPGRATVHLTFDRVEGVGTVMQNTVITRGDLDDGVDASLRIDGVVTNSQFTIVNNIFQSHDVASAPYNQPFDISGLSGPYSAFNGFNMVFGFTDAQRASFVSAPRAHLLGQSVASPDNALWLADVTEVIAGDIMVVAGDGEARFVEDVFRVAGGPGIVVLGGTPLPVYDSSHVPVAWWRGTAGPTGADTSYRLVAKPGAIVDGVDDGSTAWGNDPDGSLTDMGAYGGPGAAFMP